MSCPRGGDHSYGWTEVSRSSASRIDPISTAKYCWEDIKEAYKCSKCGDEYSYRETMTPERLC